MSDLKIMVILVVNTTDGLSKTAYEDFTSVAMQLKNEKVFFLIIAKTISDGLNKLFTQDKFTEIFA